MIVNSGYTQILNTYSTLNSPIPDNTVRAVCIEPGGTKWFGTNNGLVRYDGSEWLVFSKTDETQTLADNQISDIAFEHGGYGPEIWIGTENGLTILDVDSTDGYTFATPYRTDNRPLLGNSIQAVKVDSQHVKWIATDRGVSVFDGTNWNGLTKENGFLEENDVTCIGIDNECDSLWRYFGTRSKGVSRIYISDLDGITAASHYNTEWTFMLSDSIRDIYVVNESKHWIGSNRGVAEHDTTLTKERWTIHTTGSGLVNDRILSIAQDLRGWMWFGTEGGLSGWDGTVYSNYTTAEGMSGNAVYDIAVDVDGSLWLGTDNGITHFNPPPSTVNRAVSGQNAGSHCLYQNHPNPFNPITMIRYDLTEKAQVTITIRDISGRLIALLMNDIQEAGLHKITWDATPYPSGIYLAGFQVNGPSGQFSSCQRMVYIK